MLLINKIVHKVEFSGCLLTLYVHLGVHHMWCNFAKTLHQDTPPGHPTRTPHQDTPPGHSPRTPHQDTPPGHPTRTLHQDTPPGHPTRTLTLKWNTASSGETISNVLSSFISAEKLGTMSSLCENKGKWIFLTHNIRCMGTCTLEVKHALLVNHAKKVW